MKLSSIAILSLIVSITGSIVDIEIDTDESELEVICPDNNPINCYPKLFQPTDEWQEVKQGQIIPVGLDIRLDLENMKRMAKLLDKDDHNDEVMEKNHDLVVSKHSNGEFDSLLGFVDGFANLHYSKTSFTVIKDNFESLVDWSSDFDTGVEIAHHVQSLLKITGLYNNDEIDDYNNDDDAAAKRFWLSPEQYSTIQDMAYRILASTFRNNLDSQEILLKYLSQPTSFLQKLVENPQGESSLIVKRKLGLLGALVNNHVFDKYIKSAGIEKSLIILYSKVKDDDIRERIMNLLEDMSLAKRNEGGSDDYDNSDVTESNENPDKRYAELVQRSIVDIPPYSESATYSEILDILSNMKKEDRDLFKADPQFLNWLDQVIHAKKAKQDDTVDAVIELRHEVFGNRLGTRRDYDDEL